MNTRTSCKLRLDGCGCYRFALQYFSRSMSVITIGKWNKNQPATLAAQEGREKKVEKTLEGKNFTICRHFFWAREFFSFCYFLQTEFLFRFFTLHSFELLPHSFLCPLTTHIICRANVNANETQICSKHFIVAVIRSLIKFYFHDFQFHFVRYFHLTRSHLHVTIIGLSRANKIVYLFYFPPWYWCSAFFLFIVFDDVV